MRILEKDNGSTTTDQRFIWCDLEVCEERDATGAMTSKRFFAQGEQQGAENFYYDRDHLGSIRELNDSTGGVRARYDYDPYGRRTKISGDKDTAFAFTGHYSHAASGLVLTAYRAYDSNTARWLSEDPLGIAQNLSVQDPTANLYAYVTNGPTGFVDLLGLAGNNINLSGGWVGRVDRFNLAGSSSYEIHVYAPSGAETGVLGPGGWINKHGFTGGPVLPDGVRNVLNGLNVRELRANGVIGPRGTQNIRRGNYPGGRYSENLAEWSTS